MDLKNIILCPSRAGQLKKGVENFPYLIQKYIKPTFNIIDTNLKNNNKIMSIVMYPYPYHFLYENYDTQFIKIIRNFCDLKCNSFINTYDIFHSKMKK